MASVFNCDHFNFGPSSSTHGEKTHAVDDHCSCNSAASFLNLSGSSCRLSIPCTTSNFGSDSECTNIISTSATENSVVPSLSSRSVIHNSSTHCGMQPSKVPIVADAVVKKKDDEKDEPCHHEKSVKKQSVVNNLKTSVGMSTSPLGKSSSTSVLVSGSHTRLVL